MERAIRLIVLGRDMIGSQTRVNEPGRETRFELPIACAEIGPPQLREIGRLHADMVVVSQEMLATNPRAVVELARDMPLLETVGTVCRACPLRHATTGSGAADGCDGRSLQSCQLVASPFEVLCWNTVSRRSSLEVFETALERTAERRRFVDPAALDEREASERETQGVTLLEELTARECAIVAGICRGLSNKEIGHQLGISTNTVGNQISAILERMDGRSRIDIVLAFATIRERVDRLAKR